MNISQQGFVQYENWMCERQVVPRVTGSVKCFCLDITLKNNLLANQLYANIYLSVTMKNKDWYRAWYIPYLAVKTSANQGGM
mgnify:CR=1 FL=1